MAGIDVWDLELQDTEPDGAISHGHEPLKAFGPINGPAAFTWQRTDPSAEFSRLFPSHAAIYSAVVKSGKPNYQSARILLQHGLNVPVWKDFFADYHDTRLLSSDSLWDIPPLTLHSKTLAIMHWPLTTPHTSGHILIKKWGHSPNNRWTTPT